MKKYFQNIGPGTLVAAAFIGPGTITICTLAGAKYGLSLLWAMVLSVIATIILQLMASRLGLVTQKGIPEVIRSSLQNKWMKWILLILIFTAIVIGNAAYEAGNISGAILGMEEIFGKRNLNILGASFNLYSLLIGLIAFIALYIGSYKILERLLIFLVLLMSLAFFVTAIMSKPNLFTLFRGLLIPSISMDNIPMILALVGTTVVPYNLFLHASTISEKWKHVDDLKWVRLDTIVAIIFGGFISMCVIVTASIIDNSNLNSAADLSAGVRPLLGQYSSYFLGIGLFSAGITSAITAPLAAAYVARGCFQWPKDLKSLPFRLVWMFILALGVILAGIGQKPIDIIMLAQIANGLLLPIIAIILVWLMNKKTILHQFVNTPRQNLAGFVIIGICTILSGFLYYKLFFL